MRRRQRWHGGLETNTWYLGGKWPPGPSFLPSLLSEAYSDTGSSLSNPVQNRLSNPGPPFLFMVADAQAFFCGVHVSKVIALDFTPQIQWKPLIK